jgi:peptidoglycan/LPS O-acetylase OafA/YrhL
MTLSTAPRVAILDALRGIAALLVVAAHFGSTLSPAFGEMLKNQLSLGQLGVMIFFLCSGYVIPLALEQQASLYNFWVRRFFRLYPVYWLATALIVICGLSGALMLSSVPRAHITAELLAANPPVIALANATMAQSLLTVPSLNPVAWTLTIELLFYGLVSLLFACGLLRYSLIWTLGCLGLAVLSETVMMPVWRSALTGLIQASLPIEVLSFLAMLGCGAVLAQLHRREIPWLPAVLVIAAVFAWSVVPHGVFVLPGDRIARPLALIVFCVGLLLSRRTVPPIARFLGDISYSVYLFQFPVIWLVPQTSSRPLTALVWLLALIALATLTHRFVEQPGIALGRSFTGAARRHAVEVA